MNRSQLRGDLPEPVRRYFLEVAAMEPPADLLDAAVAEIERTPRVNRFTYVPILAFAAAVVAAVAIIGYALLPPGVRNIGGEPTPSASESAASAAPTAAATPVPVTSLPSLDGLPSAGSIVATYEASAGYPVLYAHGSVWLGDNENGTLSRMDPDTGEITASIEVNPNPATTRYDQLAVSDGTYVWATGIDETMVKIDPATNEIVERVPIGTFAYRLAIQDGQLWLTDLGQSGRVIRIDTASSEVVADERYPLWPAALAATGTDVWMAAYQDTHLLRLDPTTGVELDRFKVSGYSMEIVAFGDSLYISGNQGRPLDRFSIPEGRVVVRMGSELGVKAMGDRLFGFAAAGTFMELDPTTLEPMSALSVDGELGFTVLVDDRFYVASASQILVIDPAD